MAARRKSKNFGPGGRDVDSPRSVAASEVSYPSPALTPPLEKISPEKPPPVDRPAVDFKYQEGAVAFQLGVSARKFIPYRQELVEGRDWRKKGGRFWWTKSGLKTVLLDMGVPAGVVFPEERVVLAPTPPIKPGPWLKAVVVACNLRNERVILCQVQGKQQSVQINAQWRPDFRNGMVIEVQKAPSGYWRTQRPVRRGVFK